MSSDSENDGKDCYVIDTSSLVEIQNSKNAEQIWKTLFPLIKDGRLQAPSHVMRELANVDPDAHSKLKPFSSEFTVSDYLDLLVEAGRLTQLYPHTCGARGTHPGPADPYVIGLAKLKGHIVVTK